MQPRRHSVKVPTLIGEQSETHELVFYDWGNEDAQHVVICVHGLTRNARDFDLLAADLAARGKRVFALSMAGRGESAWLSDPANYNYATYVTDCIAVMDNFHLRGVEWIGTSMGGIIGMIIAAQNPTRIKKLVLNDVGSFLSASALGRICDYLKNMPASFASRAEADAYLRDIFKPFGITDPVLWEQFVDHSLKSLDGDRVRLVCDPAIAEPMRRESQDFTNLKDVNLAQFWDEIRIPTLILRGQNSDILDEATVNAMRSTNIRAESVTIPNVGHAPSLMNHEQIRIVSDWLTRPSGLIAGL